MPTHRARVVCVYEWIGRQMMQEGSIRVKTAFAVLPLNTWMRLSCGLHSFNMKNKPSARQVLPAQLFSSCKLSSVPAIYGRERAVNTAGVCRQHDKCRASTHLRGRPVLSCRYHIRYADGWPARQGSVRQHWCLSGFGYYRYIMPASAGYCRSLFSFLSVDLMEASDFQNML